MFSFGRKSTKIDQPPKTETMLPPKTETPAANKEAPIQISSPPSAPSLGDINVPERELSDDSFRRASNKTSPSKPLSPVVSGSPLRLSVSALSRASADLSEAARTDGSLESKAALVSKRAAIEAQILDLQNQIEGSSSKPKKSGYITPQLIEEASRPMSRESGGTVEEINEAKLIRKDLDPDAGNDFDLETAEVEISELRRVRRQVRYLFGGFARGAAGAWAEEGENTKPSPTKKDQEEIDYSARQESSRVWARHLLSQVARSKVVNPKNT